MVPNNTTPQCEMRHILVTPARPVPLASNRSKQPKGAAAAAAPVDAQLSNSQLLTLARFEMLPEQYRYGRWMPSLTTYLHYQHTPSPVCAVHHSSRAQSLVGAMTRLAGEEPQRSDALSVAHPLAYPLAPPTAKRKGRSTLPQLFDCSRTQRSRTETAAVAVETPAPGAPISPETAPLPEACSPAMSVRGDSDHEVMVVDLTGESSQPIAATQDVSGCLVMTPDRPAKIAAAGAGGEDPCDPVCSAQGFAHRRLFPHTASTVTWQATGKVRGNLAFPCGVGVCFFLGGGG
jgi:hypothetical protein